MATTHKVEVKEPVTSGKWYHFHDWYYMHDGLKGAVNFFNRLGSPMYVMQANGMEPKRAVEEAMTLVLYGDSEEQKKRLRSKDSDPLFQRFAAAWAAGLTTRVSDTLTGTELRNGD